MAVWPLGLDALILQIYIYHPLLQKYAAISADVKTVPYSIFLCKHTCSIHWATCTCACSATRRTVCLFALSHTWHEACDTHQHTIKRAVLHTITTSNFRRNVWDSCFRKLHGPTRMESYTGRRVYIYIQLHFVDPHERHNCGARKCAPCRNASTHINITLASVYCKTQHMTCFDYVS